MDDVVVRDLLADDLPEWAGLFRAYREFYEWDPADDVVARVGGWLTDPEHEVHGYVAVLDGHLVGFAHYRRFARPAAGSSGIYLDDLFTAPDVRGHGIGRRLIGALEVLAATEGRSVVRWVTAPGNDRARRLYDSVAQATPWVTYDLPVGG